MSIKCNRCNTSKILTVNTPYTEKVHTLEPPSTTHPTLDKATSTLINNPSHLTQTHTCWL